MMDRGFLLSRLMLLVPLWLSLTVHEWAHAMSAYKLGDDTAAREGRLTLNPIAHIDPVGTLLLPLLGIPFGWAKPVPINPARFTRKVTLRMGVVYTAAAGPLSNLVLVLVCAVVYGLGLRFAAVQLLSHEAIVDLLSTAIALNIGLAVFNMLPIPPLDGSRVVDGLLPARYDAIWEKYCRYSPFVLAAVIVLPNFLNVPIVSWPIQYIGSAVSRFIGAIAGRHGYAVVVPDEESRMLPGVLAGLWLTRRAGRSAP